MRICRPSGTGTTFTDNGRMRTLNFGALALSAALFLSACGDDSVKPDPAPVAQKPVKVGIALGGGAAKGFAHIGVIKMLEANGIKPAVVSGTSAGSLVGALYASGMSPYDMQTKAVELDESRIRDISLFSGGLIKGQALQNYVNAQVQNKTFQQMRKPFVAVATRLDNGDRVLFSRGNVGQAVRASCSIPGVFEPVKIKNISYVDGGVVSPVPVDAAKALGADIVIAVDIGSAPIKGQTPTSMLGVVNQSVMIMGRKLGQQELSRADVVIRPNVNSIGATDFDSRATAILEGEKAAQAALPAIRRAIAAKQKAR